MKIKLFAAFSFLSTFAFAIQDMQLDVVDQNFNSSNKVVITEDEIKQSHATDLIQLLATKTNINIFGSGFQPNTIYLRGGDSRHILILIDGIPTYDPGTIQKTANISNLNLKNIRKIEIIKGSQSVIYGGQALAGVIKIETIPEINQFKSSSSISGSMGKFDGSTSVIVPLNEKMGFNLGVSHIDENNLSPVKNSEALYPRKLYTVNGSVIRRDQFETILKINYTDEKNQISDSVSQSNFSPMDATGNNFNSNSFLMSYIIRNEKFKFSISELSSQRDIFRLAKDNPNPPPFNGEIDQNYLGKTDQIHFDYSGFSSDNFKVFLGLDFSNDFLVYKNAGQVSNKENQQYESAFLKTDYSLNLLKFEAGYRKQLSKLNSINDSVQFGIGYNNELKMEFSTGYNQPSLTQLYVYNPNPNLRPETAQTATLSYEKKFSENLFYSATLFESKFENLIFRTGSPSRNENISTSVTQGIELEFSQQFASKSATISGGYTYQEPKDLRRNSWLVRRPLHIVNVNFKYDITDALNIIIDVKKTGERTDQSGSTTYTSIPDNTIVDGSMSMKVNSNLSLFARVNNITNSVHELSYGYFAEGTNAKIGADINF